MATRSFSFGAFNRDFLAAREGFSMLILNSRNATADARSFEAAGIGGFEVFDFGREGTRPDGTPVKLAFSLVFASDAASPTIVALPRASIIFPRISGTRRSRSMPMALAPCPAWPWSRTIRPTITSS